jgi:TRAP-type uncharacterized transport system substrate-binding protein
MQSPRIAIRPTNWRGKGLLRLLLIIVTAITIAALASFFGIARDYGYLSSTLLSGIPEGKYHELATNLAERASRGHGRIAVVSTEGSVDNISRLAKQERCVATFAFVQDGTPVPSDLRVEVLGRLPQSESLLLLGRRDRAFSSFADLRGSSIGIGPEGSGTAYLMLHLFKDRDLAALDVRLSHHERPEQIEMVAGGELDLAAFVMAEDAQFIQTAVRQHDLDIAAPKEIEGLVRRHPWLSLGRVPAGLYDLARPTPPVDKAVAAIDTLVLANSCTGRAQRMALLTLLRAELPGFVRNNPPRSAGSANALPLAPEARQFFVSGEPEIADRYFPWLVDLMSPAYWVYLLMAVTLLFNAMRGFSRFRLWRIDSAREKVDVRVGQLTGPGLTREQVRTNPPGDVLSDPDSRAGAQDIIDQLTRLRARCQRYTSSFVTPMGDEMFYRYQEALIDELLAAVGALLQGSAKPAKQPVREAKL